MEILEENPKNRQLEGGWIEVMRDCHRFDGYEAEEIYALSGAISDRLDVLSAHPKHPYVSILKRLHEDLMTEARKRFAGRRRERL